MAELFTLLRRPSSVQTWLIEHPELQIAIRRGREVVATRTLGARAPEAGGTGLLGRFKKSAAAPAYWIGRGADEGAQLDAGQLGGREAHALVSRDPEGRCILHLLPGMTGELNVGVCTIAVERLLRDPAVSASDGSANYALPNGTHVRIELGGVEFVMSYGAAPLFAQATAAAPAAAAIASAPVS